MRRDRHLADRLPDRIKERIIPLFRAGECLLHTCQFEHPAESHGAVLVNEIVFAAFLNSEQEVKETGKCGRLAGLIEAEHDMQIRPGCRLRPEIEGPIGELSIANEIKASQSHDDAPAFRRAMT